ncbi:MAG: hypothetical protein ACK42Z_08195, partial [Candidatus Kapaibacteriota bacterium]
MELSKKEKIFVSLFFIGVIIWIGGSITRGAIAYDIFELNKQTIVLRPWVDEKIASITVRNFAVGSIYTIIGFLLTVVSFLFLLTKIKSNFKKEGWLLISTILYALAFVSEIILSYFDIKLNLYVFFSSNVSYYSQEIQTFFYVRLKKFSFLIIYNWLAIFTIIL